MITFSADERLFSLKTRDTGYFFRITKFGHLEHLFYGERIDDEDLSSLQLKHTAETGCSIQYSPSDKDYCLDTLALEFSGIGKGDYRHSPVEIKMPDSTFVCDFTYETHRIMDGHLAPKTLPASYGDSPDCQTLEITMRDRANQVQMVMYYTVYPGVDVITRRIVLKNENKESLTIRKLMSMMVDLNLSSPMLLTLDGAWIREAHKNIHSLPSGLYVSESTTGASSNRHNPGIMVFEQGASENYGKVYGFNLVYSGNHYEAIEAGNPNLIRVMTGISPHCFEWPLEKDSEFETPEAVMTYSCQGFNKASQNFHDFVNHHIVRGNYKGRERPVLFNSWEACFLRFTGRKLLHLARQAKKLGVELFVLDDGWFNKRDDDSTGLGDYTVDHHKLPGGLSSFVHKIQQRGLAFGLWFEPEMVNENSNLFRSHPDYAVRIPAREPSYGRHQLVLDLCNPNVRDYIVKSMCGVLDSAPISYVKWDMNRHISDMFSPGLPNQGMFFHRYILGLYDILTRIFRDRPDILLESCSSGGNRFDLGMLCFSPQIWASDNTDPVERLEIQSGLSYFYPLSTMGAHVSQAPHQQTLRTTPLSARFHMACFGNLGYELDLKYLSWVEKKEIRRQVELYKKHRTLFQFGKFYRLERKNQNQATLLCVSQDQSEAAAGFFQTLFHPDRGNDILPVCGLDPDKEYSFETVPQGMSIKRFGGLINFLLPFKLHPDHFLIRTADRFYRLPDSEEKYTGSGKLFHAGVRLNNQFMGTWYNNKTRLLGDFGSNLFLFQQIKK